MQFKKIASVLVGILAALVFVSGFNSKAQTTAQPQIDEIIKRFAAAESQNKTARNNYTFTQDVDILTLGEAGSITGRYKRVSDIVFDNQGNRFEKISYFPPSTLKVYMSQEDYQDLAGVQPFALTTEDLPKYFVDYRGKEKIDELDTYVFDVRPKEIKRGQRYLEGRIWVDDQDLQIVKVAGKSVPEVGDQRFPRFESYRENIDERYWFPTYVYSDDILEFKNGGIHFRMVVKYTRYKKFSTDIRILDEGDIATDEDVKNAEKTAEPRKDEKKEEARPKKKPPQS